MISQLIELFGQEKVQWDATENENYLQNVCAANKKILGVVYPHSTDDIIKLVQLSRHTRIPLYPISKGYNYGLGSRLPVQDNHLVVDLSNMNRILSFDADLGLLRIEPGVTQEDIADYLKQVKADFILNVTGSSAHSSVVGNAIERGIAHYGSRVNEVMGVEMVLGDGSLFSTDNISHVPFHTPGPDYKGLFFQSNFGIVTAMTLRLLPKTQCVAVVTLEKKPSIPLDAFINQLRLAKYRQMLPDNLHLSNQLRRVSIVTALLAKELAISMEESTRLTKERIHSDWAATASFRGERAVVQAQIQCLKQFIDKDANLSVLFDTDLNEASDPFLLATRGAFGHSLGLPCGDALLSLGYESKHVLNGALEHSTIGTLFLIPALPFRGEEVMKATECLTQLFHRYHFNPYMTFNLIEQVTLEGVINLIFDKTDTHSVKTAHLCIQESLAAMEQLGYPPIRLSIFQSSSFLSKDTVKGKIRNRLKHVFDPDNIIARGRYEDR